MKIQDMHYDYKLKLNRIDSNKYRNLKIPEIDWKLNEAMYIFILMVSNPRIKSHLGFETSKRNTEDILPLIIDDYDLSLSNDNNTVLALLPNNYLSYLSVANLICSKGDCKSVKLDVNIIRHQDNNDETFYDSNFEWREANIRFFNSGIKIFNNDFNIDTFSINYIRKPEYMNYAEGFLASGYKLPSGEQLTGHQDCELPEHTHSEIVDIAVLLTTGELELPNSYKLKVDKMKLNQLIN